MYKYILCLSIYVYLYLSIFIYLASCLCICLPLFHFSNIPFSLAMQTTAAHLNNIF